MWLTYFSCSSRAPVDISANKGEPDEAGVSVLKVKDRKNCIEVNFQFLLQLNIFVNSLKIYVLFYYIDKTYY